MCELEGEAEAALVSARCQFSLSTVEVTCTPAATAFGLVERAHLGRWRWAAYGVADSARQEGLALNRLLARQAALAALQHFAAADLGQAPAAVAALPLVAAG